MRSKNEALVDNWLYSHGICHAYEKAVFDRETGARLCSDFYVPGRNAYIEVWGMSSERYARRRAEKVGCNTPVTVVYTAAFENGYNQPPKGQNAH